MLAVRQLALILLLAAFTLNRINKGGDPHIFLTRSAQTILLTPSFLVL